MKTLFFALISLGAAAAADFSGTWVLNKAKSDFGVMPEQMIPEKMTRVQTLDGGVLKAKTTSVGARGETTTESTFKLDGSENVNGSAQNPVKTVAKMDGQAIVMKTTRSMQGMNLQMDERYEISADGATMKVATVVAGTPMGDIKMTYAFDRAAGAAVASAKPSFNGTWKLNKAKSNFGTMPEEYQPAAVTRVVAIEGSLARVQSEQAGAQGSLKTDLKLKLDGTESVNQMGGAEARSVAKWEGESLSVTTKRELSGMALEVAEKWTLSPDGKTYDVDMKIGGTPLGDIAMKYVFERQ